MREACKFNVQIHNGNILMSSVTEDPEVSSILLFSGSGINFPRPLYEEIQKQMANNSWRIPIRIGSMVTHFQLPPYEYH
jgi:hypothetical protein